MNANIQESVQTITKSTPIAMGVGAAILLSTAGGAFQAGQMVHRLGNVEIRQDSVEARQDKAEDNNQLLSRLVEKMDRRVEWIEKTQAKP